MAQSVFKIIYTTSDKLADLTLSPGQLIFVEDIRSIQFVNKDSELINYTSVITLDTELGRTSLSHPFPALFWVKETNILWKYDATDGWVQITTPPQKQIVFGSFESFPEVGDSETIYIDDTTMYRYLDGDYQTISGGDTDLKWLPLMEG